MNQHKTILLITLGDPYSVNIEMLVPHLVGYIQQLRACEQVILLGCYQHFQSECDRLEAAHRLRDEDLAVVRKIPMVLDLADEVSGDHSQDVLSDSMIESIQTKSAQILFMNTAWLSRPVNPMDMSPYQRGQLAYSALRAVDIFSQASDRHRWRLAVLSSPICKHEAREAGFLFPGQTEYFESIWDGHAIMVLAGPQLRVGLLTNHLPLSHVTAQITESLVVDQSLRFLKTLVMLQTLTHKKPQKNLEFRVALCGLNPHLSDERMFGDEEHDILIPALQRLHEDSSFQQLSAATQMNMKVVLEPADCAFYKALQGTYMGVLACYHDQGLGPLKTLHFDCAVNLTGGLKHLRVSPDHGPARDLYDRGRGSSKSFESCFEICKKYLRHHRISSE